MQHTQINTDGGTVVTGDVKIADGDFVGRDKNIYITDEVAYNVHGLPNPYLGLRSFTYEDRALYTGRDDEVRAALERLTTPSQQQTVLFVTGASGCGKSSFVQAGILPALETHYSKRHLSVSHAVFRPSCHPLPMLKDALTQLGIDPSTKPFSTLPYQISLLVIDQFEEIFTQSGNTDQEAFFQWLSGLPTFEQSHVHVIATIRSDYLNELAEVSALWHHAKEAIVLRAIGVNALKATIQRPLQARFPNGEKRFEPELVEKLAIDASGDPTFLPLLQVTLEEIWRKGRLVLAQYNNLADALKQRADQVIEFEDYNSTNPHRRRTEAEHRAILNILLDLVKVSLDDSTYHTYHDVRVSRNVEAFKAVEGDLSLNAHHGELLNDLVDARLLSLTNDSGTETVNIIHESLIRNWDRLQQTIAARREQLQQRTRFELSLHEWMLHNRSADYLLHGIYLAEARRLAEQGDVTLRSSGAAKELLQQSIEQSESEQRSKLAQAEARAKAERQTVVRTRLLLFAALALVAVLGVPVLYRTFLRWSAINLVELRPIVESTIVLGHRPSNPDWTEYYLRQGEYQIPAFQIERYEVTNQRYLLCMEAKACSPPNALEEEYAAKEKENFPVVNVSALQAEQFCQWIGRRLPSDFEWERVARYTDQRRWPWLNQVSKSEDIDSFANFQTGAEYGKPMAVGSFPKGASVEGVEDLAGNVWEWTQSPYDISVPYLDANMNDNSPKLAKVVSVRGGGADIPATLMENLIAIRTATGATSSNGFTGFRCAK